MAQTLYTFDACESQSNHTASAQLVCEDKSDSARTCCRRSGMISKMFDWLIHSSPHWSYMIHSVGIADSKTRLCLQSPCMKGIPLWTPKSHASSVLPDPAPERTRCQRKPLSFKAPSITCKAIVGQRFCCSSGQNIFFATQAEQCVGVALGLMIAHRYWRSSHWLKFVCSSDRIMLYMILVISSSTWTPTTNLLVSKYDRESSVGKGKTTVELTTMHQAWQSVTGLWLRSNERVK